MQSISARSHLYIEIDNEKSTTKNSALRKNTSHLIKFASWRLFDITIASLIFLLIFPFFIIASLIIGFFDGLPIFYLHKRIGRNGKSFHCIKFRTMKQNGDSILEEHLSKSPDARREWNNTQKLHSDPRVTRLGAIMRKLSFDEIPQLLNIITGDMALVGPRPIVEEEIYRYGANFEHYCRVRPGLTGIWQTNGRSDTSYQTRIEMDISYVDRKSIPLDMWLIIKTIPAVIFAKGSC